MTKQETHRSRLGKAFSLLALVAVIASACSSSGGPAAGVDSSPTPEVATAATSTQTPSPTTPPSVTNAEVEVLIASFLDAATTGNAATAVEAMGLNRSERWVPWLLDLLKINVCRR